MHVNILYTVYLEHFIRIVTSRYSSGSSQRPISCLENIATKREGSVRKKLPLGDNWR